LLKGRSYKQGNGERGEAGVIAMSQLVPKISINIHTENNNRFRGKRAAHKTLARPNSIYSHVTGETDRLGLWVGWQKQQNIQTEHQSMGKISQVNVK
jgi:hypothetical protein